MIKKALRELLHRCGYSVSNIRQVPPPLLEKQNLLEINFDLVVAHYLLGKPDFFFIQVGAFDGVQGDPLRKFVLQHNWSGVLLEPQKRAFQLLERNYANQPHLILKNAAISDRHETRTLYTVGQGDVPGWCQGLASFDREVILRHREMVPGLEHLIETEEIDCITFQELVEECQIDHVDLLQVDAEGYDGEIIRMFPFDLIRPGIVHFERKHLSRRDLTNCLDLLVCRGYKFANDGDEDLVAY